MNNLVNFSSNKIFLTIVLPRPSSKLIISQTSMINVWFFIIVRRSSKKDTLVRLSRINSLISNAILSYSL